MTAKKTPAGKTLADFRAVHDKNFVIPQKITKALEELGDSWEYELEFQKRAQLSVTDFAKFRDQFAEFWVDLPTDRTSRGKRVWAGTKTMATKLREMV